MIKRYNPISFLWGVPGIGVRGTGFGQVRGTRDNGGEISG